MKEAQDNVSELSQPPENVKTYRRYGSSIDGLNIDIEYQDGSTQTLFTMQHMFENIVRQIKSHNMFQIQFEFGVKKDVAEGIIAWFITSLPKMQNEDMVFVMTATNRFRSQIANYPALCKGISDGSITEISKEPYLAQ
jgi:hypothetical protein